MTKNKKLFFLLLMVPALCVAQIETDSSRARLFNANPRYRSNVVGVGGAYLKNTYMSPLTHSGVAVDYGFNQTRYRKKGVSDQFFDLTADVSNILNFQMKYDNFRHLLVYSRENLFFYAGAGVSSVLSVAFNTNSAGYNALAVTANGNLLPSVMLKYRLRLFSRNFDLSQQISTPLVGYGIYPRYSWLLDYQPFSDSSDARTALFFTSLHNRWGLNSRTYIDWRFKEKEERSGKKFTLKKRRSEVEKNSFLRFGYWYEGSRVNFDGHSYQLSRGVFFAGIITKF